MLRFLKLIVLVIIAAIVVLLALVNKMPVTLSLDVSGGMNPDLSLQNVPLYLVILAAAAVGILLGGCGAWLAQGRNRRERRQFKRELNQLKTRQERSGTPAISQS